MSDLDRDVVVLGPLVDGHRHHLYLLHRLCARDLLIVAAGDDADRNDRERRQNQDRTDEVPDQQYHELPAVEVVVVHRSVTPR